MMTLTLNSLVTTYTMLALASVFQSIVVTRPAVKARRFDGTLVLGMLGRSLLFLAGMFVFIRLFLVP